jgi:hypothetical protein
VTLPEAILMLLRSTRGEALTLDSVEVSGCGTAGDLTNSGIVIRSTAGTESGGGTIRFLNNYFELNNGTNLRVENGASTSLGIYMENNKFLATETITGVRNTAIIGSVDNLVMIQTYAASSIDTITIAVNRSVVCGGVIGVLTDSSTVYEHVGVKTTAASGQQPVNKWQFERRNVGAIQYLIGDSSQITGGGAGVLESFTADGGSGGFAFTVNTRQDTIGGNTRAFFGGTPVTKRAITGALSAVTDANAKAVLTSIITALDDAGYNLVTDSTT